MLKILQPGSVWARRQSGRHYSVLTCQKYTMGALKLCGSTSYSSTLRISNIFFESLANHYRKPCFFAPISERRIIRKDFILTAILILGQCKGALVLFSVLSQVSTSFFSSLYSSQNVLSKSYTSGKFITIAWYTYIRKVHKLLEWDKLKIISDKPSYSQFNPVWIFPLFLTADSWQQMHICSKFLVFVWFSFFEFLR